MPAFNSLLNEVYQPVSEEEKREGYSSRPRRLSALVLPDCGVEGVRPKCSSSIHIQLQDKRK